MTTSSAPVLLWLRRELRLADNPALGAALASGRPVVVAFVLDDESPGPWAPGGVLERAGVRLGASYPRPIVDLAAGRARALEAFAGLRRAA